MRCFIAIDLSEGIIKKLTELQSLLAEKAGIEDNDVKWVATDAMHLTLKFLGNVPDNHVVNLCHDVEDVAVSHKRFELDIESISYFGSDNSAKVLWVGVGAGSEELDLLQSDLEESLARKEWPKEVRKFVGHLTLCRVKRFKVGRRIAKAAANYADCKLGTISADSLRVYESKLRARGPVYTLLGKYELR